MTYVLDTKKLKRWREAQQKEANFWKREDVFTNEFRRVKKGINL